MIGVARHWCITATIVWWFSLSLLAQPGGEGWSPPSDTELGDVNRELRAASPARYLEAPGDFNGDGREDRAAIMVRRSTGEAAVVVFIAGRVEYPVFIATFPSSAIGQLGIQTIKPGTYEPACARGGGPDCDRSTRVTIPHDGISVFAFESSSTYYWLEGDRVRSLVMSV